MEVIAELDMIYRRCNPVATSSNFAWYNLAMDDEVDVDDEEANEQPKNKQPRTTAWPCRLQALDLTAFIFRRGKLRGRHSTLRHYGISRQPSLPSVITIQ